MEKSRAENILELGRHIDKLQCDKGYSMREFASICNIHKSQVNELTNLGVDFRYSTLVNIANGLEMSVIELISF